MQGKQYALGGARTINGIKFEDASPALEALQDYGCLHYKVHIICGVSEPRYSPSELKKLNAQNAKVYGIDGKKMSGYDCTQAMRRLETEVRKQKDIRETARASGDTALVKNCNERIKAYKAKYTEISNITGIPEEPRRMSKPRMPKTDNNIISPTSKVLTNSGNGGIIEMYRRTTNSGAFSILPERMSKKHIRALAKECNIDLKGITLNIDYNEELIRIPFTGRADHENIGQITFFANAFRSKEDLIRTLYHEIQHVRQYKKYGVEFVLNNNARFEDEAYALEDIFIKLLKERRIL